MHEQRDHERQNRAEEHPAPPVAAHRRPRVPGGRSFRTALKIEIQEKAETCGRPLRSFDDSLRTALAYIGNPGKYWASERFEAKRAVLKLTFSDRLAYVRNSGFRTPNLALPFKALAGICGAENAMARPERFELPTLRFEA